MPEPMAVSTRNAASQLLKKDMSLVAVAPLQAVQLPTALRSSLGNTTIVQVKRLTHAQPNLRHYGPSP